MLLSISRFHVLLISLIVAKSDKNFLFSQVFNLVIKGDKLVNSCQVQMVAYLNQHLVKSYVCSNALNAFVHF